MIILNKIKTTLKKILALGDHPANIENSQIGTDCLIDKNSYIKNSVLGNYVRVASGTTLSECTFGLCSYVSVNSSLHYVDVGKFCSIAQRVQNRLANHPTRYISSHPAFYSKMPNSGSNITFADKEYFDPFSYGRLSVGNDVWVGANSLLLNGITIGNGAIVAAGAVVTKDVPPYAVVGGVPAKIIRYRFSENVISALLTFKWWDRDIHWLQENYKDFHSMDVFYEKHLSI